MKYSGNLCALCRYCLFNRDRGKFVCYNEKSEKYGCSIENTHSDYCDDFEKHCYNSISIEEAERILTTNNIGCYPVFREKSSGESPFMLIEFNDNKDLADWRDAYTKIFLEFIRKERGKEI